MRELRIAVRSLARQPGTAALAVVALALGIGLTTTMFSIVNGAVLRGLPFPESDRILHLAPFNIAEQDDVDARVHTFAELRDRQQSFEELAGFQFQTANVVGPSGTAVRYQAANVTSNVFRLLKVAPTLGRDFRDQESRPGAAPVVMIGDKDLGGAVRALTRRGGPAAARQRRRHDGGRRDAAIVRVSQQPGPVARARHRSAQHSVR